MKIFFVILSTAFIASQTEAVDVEEVSTKDVYSVLDEKLRKFLENFKETLKNGDESKNIPPLDPYASPPVNIQFPKDFEDLQGNLSINSIGISRLSEYIVEDATLEVVRLKLNVSLEWPEIQGNLTGYDINSRLMNFVNVYGKGFAKFTIKNFKFALNTSTTKNKTTDKLNMQILGIDFSVGGFEIELDGLYNDTMISEVFSGVISDLAPGVFETYKPQLLTAVENFISKAANDVIGDLSISDIIGIISGKKMRKHCGIKILM